MDNAMICAYLWRDIIRIGFSPSGKNDQKRWLRQYGFSLRKFWGLDEYPETPKDTGAALVVNYDCEQTLQLCLECCIEGLNKFVVRFLYNHKEMMWLHDVDGQYFTFPSQLFLSSHNQRHLMLGMFCRDDIARVVDGLIAHPAAHMHLECPIDKHEIRIGGGIDNPFLFLFHLRFQLCPFKEKRDLERERLIELFYKCIQENIDRISPSELLK